MMLSRSGSLQVAPVESALRDAGRPHEPRESQCQLGRWSSRHISIMLDQLLEQQQQALNGLSISKPANRPSGVIPATWQLQATGKPAAAAVLQDLDAERISAGGVRSMSKKACREMVKSGLDDSLFIIDLGNATRLFKAWRAALPRVMPFYAVSCNPEPGMLRLLNALGAGFDCASMGEVDMMLKMGVHPSRIVFAHPCKRPQDLHYAKDHGIEHTTFDAESELHKVASLHPRAKLLLRIRVDNPAAPAIVRPKGVCPSGLPLGLKYGAEISEAPVLLSTAKQLGLDVVGVSFQVDNASQNLDVFKEAVASAQKIFEQAKTIGFDMEVLDIGDGVAGQLDAHGNVMFGEFAQAVNATLAKHFPANQGVRIIAQPGRYFAETMATLVTPVYGQRDRIGDHGETKKDYWITDGLYGSFNCMIYDNRKPDFSVVRSPLLPEASSSEFFKSTLWGPTCDSIDVICKDHPLPALRNGDAVLFPHLGYNSVSGACNFNGIIATSPKAVYVFSQSAVDAPGTVAEAVDQI